MNPNESEPGLVVKPARKLNRPVAAVAGAGNRQPYGASLAHGVTWSENRARLLKAARGQLRLAEASLTQAEAAHGPASPQALRFKAAFINASFDLAELAPVRS